MTIRKTLEQANAEKGYFDTKKFDSLADADIERMIADDPDLAPPTERLAPLLAVRDIRAKLGLTRRQLAEKLCIPLATLRDWEHGHGETDPAVQALLRILDKIPEPALRACSTKSSLISTAGRQLQIGDDRKTSPWRDHAATVAGRDRELSIVGREGAFKLATQRGL